MNRSIKLSNYPNLLLCYTQMWVAQGWVVHLTSRLVCSNRMLVNARETCLRETAVIRSVIISANEMKLLISKG